MSSPADSLVAPETVFDRRFYPRSKPSSFTRVMFGPEISGQLVDLGENGFRLAAPFELSSNFVCHATLPLSGLERPIEVCVRVVWTGEANQAGIQFMDLTDEDRAQIRQWAALQENTAGPVGSTEILNNAGTQADSSSEPEPEDIQAAPVVAESPKRKNRIGVAVVVGAACFVVLTMTGLAVWASPLGSWVANSLAAGTKSVFAMANSRIPENVSASAPLPQPNVTESADAADAVTTENVGMQEAGKKKPDLKAANEVVSQKPTTPQDAVKSSAAVKYSEQSKSVAKANAIPAAGAASEDKRNLSSEAPVRSADKPDGDMNSGSLEEKIETKPHTRLPGTAVAQPVSTSDAVTSANGTRADFRPSRPDAPPATTSKEDSVEPEIIQIPEPASRLVDVVLPNSQRPSIVNVPGERILQSGALTLRIQRAIVAPARHATWSTERKQKVVLGDLLSRVDPRAPRTVGDEGSRVTVRVMLGKDGRVQRLMPVNGPAELVPRVMRAVREWCFQPTLLEGKPVETAALVTIEFRGQVASAATR